MNILRSSAACLAGLLIWGSASAGPFILDLTDADDHGFSSSGANQNGWFYMQRVLENLAPGVTNGNMVVASLGSSGSASNAASSAFSGSSLPGSGWTWANIDGTTALTDFFNGTGATNINNTGIITIDSGNNIGGGITSTELAIINANASALDGFLGGGGGLHSMAEGGTGQYGWLSTLLPGLTFTAAGGSGTLGLTPDGSAAFPGLTNADLNAGPFHGHWTSGFGGLTQLFVDTATGTYNNVPVGIGSSGGSVTNPNPPGPSVPEPGTLALLGLGALLMARMRPQRRRS